MIVGDEGAVICIISTIPAAVPDRREDGRTRRALRNQPPRRASSSAPLCSPIFFIRTFSAVLASSRLLFFCLNPFSLRLFLRKIQRGGGPSQAARDVFGPALLACGAVCIKICNMAGQGESHGVCKASGTERQSVRARALPRRHPKTSLPGLLQLPAVQRRSLRPLPFGGFQAGSKQGGKP